ncbi:antitoxin VapB family protein [Candidatus Woesearchaeota archaeon]|nr:antitoxin VapB family protein [Candidatus Woesearchaeota archaeon]
MATKELTITEKAYNVLCEAKYEDESFSEEIIRVCHQKHRRPLSDFFGIISEEEGQAMLDDLKKIKEEQKKLHTERIKRLYN